MIDPLKVRGEIISVWKFITTELLKECDYTCQQCGKHKGKLDIHHKDGCPLNNRLDNLTVLCRECHQLAHQELKRQQGIIVEYLPLEFGRFGDKGQQHNILPKDIRAEYDKAFPRA